MTELWQSINETGIPRDQLGCIPSSNIVTLGTQIYDWKVIEHYKLLRPAQNQRLNSCEAESTANLLEWWIAKLLGKKVSIDGEKIYREARRLMWESEEDAGLYIGDSLHTLDILGVLPKGSEVRFVKRGVHEILRALEYSPIVTGHSIHDGWMPKNLNRDNGCVDESYNPEPGMGHATLMVGSNLHNNVELFVFINSWGKFPPMNGLFAMTPRHSLKSMLSDPVQLVVPNKVYNWDAWQAYVMRDP